MERASPRDMRLPEQVASLVPLVALPIEEATWTTGNRATLADLRARLGERTVTVVRRAEFVAVASNLVARAVAGALAGQETRLSALLAERERAAAEEARARVLGSLVDLADMLDTVVDAADRGAASVPMKAIRSRLDRIFETHGYERIPTVGLMPDPRLHEIVAREATAAVPEGAICSEVARGYRRGGFVLRVARVAVSEGGGHGAPRGD